MRSLLLVGFLLIGTLAAQAQEFEERVHDVGNVGLTVTNAGYIGRANIRNSPTGAPSFEYPLDSGVEHLFEAGLWVGAFRADGTVTVRTGAVVNSSGYQPGRGGYELLPLRGFDVRSSLLNSPFFTPRATSQEDFITAYEDTSAVIPGTFTPHPDPAGELGIKVEQRSYAWSFPFTEYFVITNFDVINVSDAPWDSVYVGLYHDLVVRNVNTTTDAGGAFFNKNGLGYLDSLYTTYAFNAGGQEETINTYGAISYLGGEWTDPQTGQTLYFHPEVEEQYTTRGLPAPRVNPRWWLFAGSTNPDLNRPTTDEERYRRMAAPYPDPALFASEAEYEAANNAWRETLRTGGQTSQGNWIGMTAVGPFSGVAPGDTVKVTFAFVGALKPEEFQGQPGKPVDNTESRRILRGNIEWAQRTFQGEDADNDGMLGADEDVNGNGRLDRYLIPEPPPSPNLRVELSAGKATLYWDEFAEEARDPVSGEQDFEGYKIYRSNPGDDRLGNILNRTTLIAQYDRAGNTTGINNGLEAIRLAAPVIFPGDPTEYWYRFEDTGLSDGFQYAYAVTAFDEGDAEVGLESFESSRVANAVRVFPGTAPVESVDDGSVGVFPNPYRASALWDGGTNRTSKLYFYNLPARAEIRIYSLSGKIVKEIDHDAATYKGDGRWFDTFSGPNRVVAGGVHDWDILSDNSLNIAGGLYLFSVKNLDSGETQTGKFVIIK